MITFAKGNPQLAKHVKRLHVLAPTDIVYEAIEGVTVDSNFGGNALDSKWTATEKSKVRDEVLQPLIDWREGQKPYIDRVIDTVPLHFLQNIVSLLPNLQHLENGASLYLDGLLAKAGQKLFNTSGIDAIVNVELIVRAPSTVFERGFRTILGFITDKTTSMKLREVDFSLSLTHAAARLPTSLQHLDFNMCGHDYYTTTMGVSPWRFIRGWRSCLKNLIHLKTLRLEASHRDAISQSYWSEVNHRFYIDYLLVNPRRRQTDIVKLPCLRSLTLVNCTLNLEGFLAIAAAHKSTLELLSLRRLTFDKTYSPKSWSEIATMIRNALPELKHLCLSRLVTWFLRDNGYGPRNVPTAQLWNQGTEGETSYEWRKAEQGRPTIEKIGPLCPWNSSTHSRHKCVIDGTTKRCIYWPY